MTTEQAIERAPRCAICGARLESKRCVACERRALSFAQHGYRTGFADAVRAMHRVAEVDCSERMEAMRRDLRLGGDD